MYQLETIHGECEKIIYYQINVISNGQVLPLCTFEDYYQAKYFYRQVLKSKLVTEKALQPYKDKYIRSYSFACPLFSDGITVKSLQIS